ncbi:MAG TPA: hypothetical protein ENH62_03220 [Marinobacter sp.]|uniref:Uncharacterized protein n=2 Tax=marine sediment metagenome TaxID=412755 RepID=A0A0F9M7V5_9ZZZZ|nr:hypothetical protein [Marinobacter sp.]
MSEIQCCLCEYRCDTLMIGEQHYKLLQAELGTAKAENEDLCNTVEATRQDMADMLAGTLEGRLKDENKRLRGALEEIHITAARQCDCKPNGGLYACELHRSIAEQVLEGERP